MKTTYAAPVAMQHKFWMAGIFAAMMLFAALAAMPQARAAGSFSLYLGTPGVMVERGYPPPPPSLYRGYPSYPPPAYERRAWVPGRWVPSYYGGWVWQPGYWQQPRHHHHHRHWRDDDDGRRWGRD